MSRLLHTGQVIVDLVMGLDTLPASGGDVLANSASFQVGGGFNVMAAARRNGLPVVYLGRHGDGRFGELARAAMQAEGVEMALAASAGKDTGLCVSLTEASTERTFISYLGAEGELSADDLAQIVPRIDDYVYVSGYSLLLEGKAQPLLDWLLALPREIVVVFDPGPLVKAPDSALMRALLPRIDIWTSNGPEALAFTGAADMSQALPTLSQHLQALLVVRDGPNGCWVGRGAETEQVPGFKVQAVDSNGAGDAHAGVFIAGLAQGLKPVEAARRANAAAALAVTRWGPATSPGVTEVDALLAE
ncbi:MULTISPECIES: PfkB family carbohydrate kinase [Pseudomonas]|uniref:PfkB family carbohydrate kinase n=1 Tax=Pseudomonas TaxID=286 RepID=UPI001C30A2F6|nr:MULTISPECIES: PfkB family carbohydrate kinase [Pseudomonas]MBV2083275.1 bifunctional hydroxymethylpyrimidine kinase/phosphomethylpyrimidine kinase [Pseudomonas carnis]MBV2088883.1 bifunctional hydroxymethylpyrimidine kinase/phosphomethylpyrimidine kinase [Pseudomonas carnis]MDO3689935.1 PfkB family carbohydrate kinase [Pseudomonas sp. DKN 2791]MDO7033960.1 PfkB family carbohydrate kinase [Pseudomonas sp. DKN 2792]